VGDVEEGGGFVEQQQRCLLRQGERDPDTLTLPARQFVDVAVSEIEGAGRRHRCHDRRLVRVGPLAQE
jgi:hypothetical protein